MIQSPRGPSPPPGSPANLLPRPWLLAAWIFACFLMGASLLASSMVLIRPEEAGILWPPAGVALAIAIVGGPRFWPTIFLGASIAATLAGSPVLPALGYGVVATVSSAIATIAMQRLRFRYWFEDRRDLVTFFGAGAILGSGVAALVGPGLLRSFGSEVGVRAFERHPLEWWVGDATGALLVGSTLALLSSRLGRKPQSQRSGVGIIMAVAVAIFATLAIFTREPSSTQIPTLAGAILILLPVFWVSLRLRPVEASVFASALCLIATWGTCQGYGPFIDGTTLLGTLWAYIVALFSTVLLLSLLLREERRSSSRAKANRNLLQRIVDSVPAVINVKDHEGRFVFMNERQVDLLGQPLVDLLGRTSEEVNQTLFGRTTTEMDREVLLSGIVSPESEVHLEDREGVIHTFLQTRMPMPGDQNRELLTLLLDITDRKRAERRLKESEARLQSVVDSVAGWILMMDLDGTITFANRGLDDIPIEGLVGTKTSEWVDDQYFQRGFDLRQQVIETRTAANYEVKLQPPHNRWLSIVLSPVTDDDEVVSLMLLVTDVTDLHNEAAERRRLEEQILHVKRVESLGALAGSVAHDFNNLLVGILGNAELALRRTPEDSREQKVISRIVKAAERAAELCDQLLDYSGRGQLRDDPIDLGALVEELVPILEGRISERARIQFDLANNLPVIAGDPAQLNRVFMNLIVNASDALADEEGSIKIRTYTREGIPKTSGSVAFESLPQSGQFVVVDISDDGCGMDPETLEKVFDPFFSTKFSGRGLGLAAAQGLIRRHGGAIEVDSIEGGGTTFLVSLPVSTTVTKTVIKPELPVTLRSRADGEEILIVDDEEVVLNLATMALEEVGFKVTAARDGLEGVQMFESSPERFGAIVLDLTMPRMTGDEVLRRIRHVAPQVPVLVSSGYARGRIADRVRLHSGISFLHKPYRPEELANTMLRLTWKQEEDSATPAP